MPPFAAAVIFVLVCPLLGGLQPIDWIVWVATGHRLSQQGTGNVSVSAAFYHGGTVAGILAVCSEATKGIAAVLLARVLFPDLPALELVALLLLVLGRFAWGRGAGITNVVWGCALHNPGVAFLTFIIGGISFTLVRERKLGRTLVLALYPALLWMLAPHALGQVLAAIALAGTLALIYQSMPDDLTLPAAGARPQSRTVFRFFQGDRALLTLDMPLDPARAGDKAATLARLRAWGYPVPPGWVLLPGDDPAPLIAALEPCTEFPFIVRSSAPGEDSEASAAAGIYTSIAGIVDRGALGDAILHCQQSYNRPEAVQYRRDRQQPDTAMAVLVQRQVRGTVSGVAFSRDPVDPLSEAVAIEALPGGADRVVSGRETPGQYRVSFAPGGAPVVSGPSGEIPMAVLEQVAYIARELEDRFHGIPQDVEWTFDGEQLWLLQARPIGTLQPIWTRKIAAEVIPGFVPPLTWSLNRPLTCGVWGDLFAVVLGARRSADLDFGATATLHYSRAYFNATLLGQIFRRMGLPAESLEFLTRGAKFSKPPLATTLRNLPGLLRLLGRELNLEQDFDRTERRYFHPLLKRLGQAPPDSPTDRPSQEILAEITLLRERLRQATYYNILAPLSFALRQALLKVGDRELDPSVAPEVAALQELSVLAVEARNLLPHDRQNLCNCPSLFATIAETADGASILERFNDWLARYGYLSEAATDVAVPRWREHPGPTREAFTRYLCDPDLDSSITKSPKPTTSDRWQAHCVQGRLALKARVAETYDRLLAHLRWQLIDLARGWCERGILQTPEELFYLEWDEVESLACTADPAPELIRECQERLHRRQARYQEDREIAHVPDVLYGDSPDPATLLNLAAPQPQRSLQGIAASPGEIVGSVRVLERLHAGVDLEAGTILVVPYTDAGWAPLLARSGGIVAEVGGRLSHGAIVAREYGIPAVMDVTAATQLLRDGQTVRLDGRRGLVEILD